MWRRLTKWLDGRMPTPMMVAEAASEGQGKPFRVEVRSFAIACMVIGGLAQLAMILVISLIYTLGGALFLMITTGGPFSFTFDLVWLAMDTNSGPHSQIITLFANSGTIITVLIYSRVTSQRSFASLGYRRHGLTSEYAVGLGVGALLFASAVGICLLTGSIEFISMSPQIVWGLILMFFLGYLVQGMSEELVCRGYFITSFAHRLGMSVAILLSSALFSFMHFLNPNVTLLALFNLLLFGVFAAVYFVKRGDIWGVAAIHSAWNFVQGNVLGIPVSGMTPYATIFELRLMEQGGLVNGGAFGLEGGLAVTFVLVVATVLMLFSKSRNVAPVDSVSQESA